jgi:hypothetical protein
VKAGAMISLLDVFRELGDECLQKLWLGCVRKRGGKLLQEGHTKKLIMIVDG